MDNLETATAKWLAVYKKETSFPKGEPMDGDEVEIAVNRFRAFANQDQGNT